MSLTERLTQDLTAAMKAKDSLKTGVLRMAKAAFKNREIDKKAALDDAEAVKVLASLVKQRQDAAEQFQAANRTDLAEKELAELEVLKTYLPQEASADAIEQAVAAAVAETGATSMKDMGRVMKAVLAALESAGAAADGKKVNEIVRRRLSGQ